MFNISSFLSKISKNISDTDNLKKIISENIYKNTNIDIKPEYFTVKDNVVYINTSPTYKSKIFINKEKIISELSPFSNITDIR
ncbi:MAG: hypothetical protein WC095_00955 [Candidatus Paceibacterota bacterium]